MANIFNIDWNNVGINLLPWFYRATSDDNEAKIVPFIRSIYAPIQDISDNLLTLEQDTIEYLNYSGQHKILEEYLNDLYDVTLRRITITENNLASIDAIQMGLTSDTIIDKIEIGLSGETVTIAIAISLSGESLSGNNFSVNMPASITFDTILLTAQLRNYVEASKNFNFIIV